MHERRAPDQLQTLGREADGARGLSGEVSVSPKTARNHIEHIYTKIGATSRVTASLFAMQQGLLPEPPAVAVDA